MFGSADGGFKNVDARRRYLVTYDRLRALSPPPDVVHDVSTNFGVVRVYQHGPARGVPVVLIHGFFLTSAMWWQQIGGLSEDFTVYAVDMLGQPGASVQSKRMPTVAHGARCIDAVLAGLGLHGVHLVAHSYGGWLATHTASRTPDRLATLTLIDPANTVTRLSAKCWRSLALLVSFPNSARARRAAGWVTGDRASGSSVDMLTELFVAGFATFVSFLRTPSLQFSGNRLLRSVRLPVQVLLAGNTVHDSRKAVRRIEAVVPGWNYRLWPTASHLLPAEIADEVNDCIREFALGHGSSR
ncbi:alpha/beta hydrolase [Mycolicibacillus trivialis]